MPTLPSAIVPLEVDKAAIAECFVCETIFAVPFIPAQRMPCPKCELSYLRFRKVTDGLARVLTDHQPCVPDRSGADTDDWVFSRDDR